MVHNAERLKWVGCGGRLMAASEKQNFNASLPGTNLKFAS
jgi:hypothetical protein